MGTVILAYV